MPLISVIVPVYKVEPYLHRCVDSILNQSYQDFELILVDDGSPDNCGAICDEYARQDSRIRVIHQQNGGLSAARNAGIDWSFANSNSQWLTFVDSDDWVHRDYLRILIQAVSSNDSQIVMCRHISTNKEINMKPVEECSYQYMDAEKAYSDYYVMCMIACCKLYKKELFKEVRFPTGKLHEDCYITHIPLFEAGRVTVCDEGLYFYFTNPGSITRTKWTEKRLQEIEAHELRLKWLKEHSYEYAWRRELEAYVLTIYEHAEAVAVMEQEDKCYHVILMDLKRKLRAELTNARSVGIYAFEREYLWIYLMAYFAVPVWRIGQFLRKKWNSYRFILNNKI